MLYIRVLRVAIILGYGFLWGFLDALRAQKFCYSGCNLSARFKKVCFEMQYETWSKNKSQLYGWVLLALIFINTTK